MTEREKREETAAVAVYQGNSTEGIVQHSVCFPLHSLEGTICRRLDNTIGHRAVLYKLDPFLTRLNLGSVHRTLWAASHRPLVLIDSSGTLRKVYKGSHTLLPSYVSEGTEENHNCSLYIQPPSQE
jgi:hypothetical protein